MQQAGGSKVATAAVSYLPVLEALIRGLFNVGFSQRKDQPCAAGTTLLSATQRKEGKLLIAMVGLPTR
jgi:hypothetical protein